MRFIIFTLLILLTACQIPPELADNSGKGCWRYGVLEEGNTGRMTIVKDVHDIQVVSLNYEDLLIACGMVDDRTLASQRVDGNYMVLRACFIPRPIDGKSGQDIIYSYNLNWGKNNYYIQHERCHALLGREHNTCWNNGYGIGKYESACNWDSEAPL